PLLVGTNGCTTLLGVDPKGRFVAAVMDATKESRTKQGATQTCAERRRTTADDIDTKADEMSRSIQLWDARSGVTRSLLTGTRGQIKAIAISADGDKIAAGSSSGEIMIWNTGFGDVLPQLPASAKAISALGFSQDGARLISITGDKAVEIWDLDQKTLIQTL